MKVRGVPHSAPTSLVQLKNITQSSLQSPPNPIQPTKKFKKKTDETQPNPWTVRRTQPMIDQLWFNLPIFPKLLQVTPGSPTANLWGSPCAGSGVVIIDPLRFLAGCRTRRLNVNVNVNVNRILNQV